MSDRQPHIGNSRTLADRIAALPAEKRDVLFRRLKRASGYCLVGEGLRTLGITHVYGVSGRPVDEVLPACARFGIRPIGVYHQASAVFMAAAQNYVSGRLTAAVVVSAGPAVTSAATGILTAYDNCWPVIVIGGRRTSFQSLDALPLMKPITKWCESVPATDEIPQYLARALRASVSGRPGPVYLDVHEDVLAGIGYSGSPTDPGAGREQPPPVPDQTIDDLVAAVSAAKRPGLIVGKGVRWSVDPADLRELVDRAGLPFITSPMGRGYVPDDHPLCFNMARLEFQSRADLLLIVGARLNWMFRHGADFSPGARVIQIDISPERDPLCRDRSELVQGDAGDCIHRLVELLRRRNDPAENLSRRIRLQEWQEVLNDVRSTTTDRIERLTRSDSVPISPYRLMREIRDVLPRNAICVTEGNVSMTIAQQVIPTHSPASRLDAGTNGCMGVGIPFALGAKMACPDRPVVAVCGDYGFSLSAMELETCVRQQIPLVVIVVNNSGNNGSLKQRHFPPDYPERVTMFQTGLRYEQLVEAVGGKGFRVTRPSELRDVLLQALRTTGLVCVNIIVDPDTALPNAWGPQQFATESHGKSVSMG